MNLETSRVVPRLLCLAGLALGAWPAFAGPPFMTDDPEPVEYRHSEAYVFSTYDRGPHGDKSFAAPAFEFNTSPAPDWHLHAMLPFAGVRPDDGPDEYGLGDVELGVKYRFLHETDTRPQAGFFPMIYVPTGDADRGLGNDRVWGTFPLWLQKSFGPWTTYGGGGRASIPPPACATTPSAAGCCSARSPSA